MPDNNHNFLSEPQISLINRMKTKEKVRLILIAPPGSGKTMVLKEIIRGLNQFEEKRVLVITTALVLVDQFHNAFEQQVDAEVVVLNKKTFREIDQPIDISHTWTNSVILTTWDTLKSPEIQEFIYSLTWDLIAVDGIHCSTSSQISQVLNEIVSRVEVQKMLLISLPGNERCLKASLGSNYGQFTQMQLTHSYTIDPTHIKIKKIDFSRTPQEIEFINQYTKIIKFVKISGIQKKILSQSISSSFYAAEKTLRTIRNYIAHSNFDELFQTEDEDLSNILDEEIQVDSTIKLEEKDLSGINPHKFLEQIEKALNLLDQMKVDSKYEVLIKSLEEFKDRQARIWVYCKDQSTTLYLGNSLVESNRSVFPISNQIRSEEIEENLKQFVSGGGILISPSYRITNKIKGMDLELDGLIFYDIPSSKNLTQFVISKAIPQGKNKECTIVLLEDTSKVIPSEIKRNLAVETLYNDLTGDFSFHVV